MKKILSSIVPISICLFSCADFIEKKITNDTISILAPSNNTNTIQLTHTFWWEELDGAETYNLQIVEGTFSNVTNLVLDTTVGTNKFLFSLSPGTFQWRVKGVNNGYETAYTTFNIAIDSSSDLTTQQLIVNSPADDFITNSTDITFSWQQLVNADDYTFKIYENTWGETLVLGPEITPDNSYTVLFHEGTFWWGVQGNNNSSNTSTSFAIGKITVDTTSPGQVTLNAPADNASLSDGYNTFSWSQASNSGTAITETIYFYSDLTASNLIKSVSGISSGHTDSLGIGTFYWRVQSIDAAGNSGEPSVIRSFTVL